MIRLTEGSLSKLMQGEPVDSPVLQYLGNKLLGSSSNLTKYRLMLNDGRETSPYVMLEPSLNHFILENKLDEFAILQINNYNSTQINSTGSQRWIVVIRDFIILVNGVDVGSQVNYNARTTGANQKGTTAKLAPLTGANEPNPAIFSLFPVADSLSIEEDSMLGLTLIPNIPQKDQEDHVSEALTSMHLGLRMKSSKKETAMKLFQIALTLAPKHPDVLNNYGEFLEQAHNDITRANLYYVKALTYEPTHVGALNNEQRTAGIVEELDQSMLHRIDEKQKSLSNIPENNASLIRAKKEAYFQHIYHTVGIEGNTMNLAQTKAIVETQFAVADKSINEHNEILGLDAAMKYINATLLNRVGSISVEDILEIHRRVLGHVDPIEGGKFRQTQVYVRAGYTPPGPGDLHDLMEEFVLWLNSEAAKRMHPIRYAANAHDKLVNIHPFVDGNGRTSRLLMNVILMRAGYPTVIVHKQQRHKYFELLNVAHSGDIRPFIRFIAECTEHTLDSFLSATSESTRQVPALNQDASLGSDTIPLENSVDIVNIVM